MSWWRRNRTPAVSDPATCAEVLAVLQRHLDGELDDRAITRLVAAHLDACRDCGLEAETYESLKNAVRRGRAPADAAALARLHTFAEHLAGGHR